MQSRIEQLGRQHRIPERALHGEGRSRGGGAKVRLNFLYVACYIKLMYPFSPTTPTGWHDFHSSQPVPWDIALPVGAKVHTAPTAASRCLYPAEQLCLFCRELLL